MHPFYVKINFSALPPLVVLLVRFAVGVTLGVFAHYLFYRVSLPVEPFIYVAF